MTMSELIKNLPDKDYFAYPAASNSTISRMKKSAAHCKYAMDNPMDPTASMALGSLVHTLILEPHLFETRYHVAGDGDPSNPRKQSVVAIIDALNNDNFNDLFAKDIGDKPRAIKGKADEIFQAFMADDDIKRFVVEPPMNKRASGGKEEFAEFQRKCERENLVVVKQSDIDSAVEYYDYAVKLGDRSAVNDTDYMVAKNYYDYLQIIGDKTIVSADQLEKATGMAASVHANKSAKKLLSAGDPEVTVLWEDPDTQYPCKGRIDFVSDLGYLVDIKTSSDASLSEFSRSIAKYGYHRQNAMYKDGYIASTGIAPKGFIFIVVESSPPFAVGVYSLDQFSVEKGAEEYKALLTEFAECQKTGIWPAYSESVQTIDLPSWYK